MRVERLPPSGGYQGRPGFGLGAFFVNRARREAGDSRKGSVMMRVSVPFTAELGWARLAHQVIPPRPERQVVLPAARYGGEDEEERDARSFECGATTISNRPLGRRRP